MPKRRVSVPSYEQVERQTCSSSYEATVIDAQYGVLRMIFHSKRVHSIAVDYWVNVAGYLRGGSNDHDQSWYREQIQSLEGTELDGYVIGEPSELTGTWYTTTLETDLAEIEHWSDLYSIPIWDEL